MRVNIWIPDSLLSSVDTYCGEHRYGRSELIQELLRERVGGKTQEGGSEIKKGLPKKLEVDFKENEVPKKTRSTFEQGRVELDDETAEELQNVRKQLEKAPLPKEFTAYVPPSLMDTINKQKKKSLICVKHGGQLIGNHYTCGCE